MYKVRKVRFCGERSAPEAGFEELCFSQLGSSQAKTHWIELGHISPSGWSEGGHMRSRIWPAKQKGTTCSPGTLAILDARHSLTVRWLASYILHHEYHAQSATVTQVVTCTAVTTHCRPPNLHAEMRYLLFYMGDSKERTCNVVRCGKMWL